MDKVFGNHPYLWFFASILLALGVSVLVIGSDHAMANLVTFWNVKSKTTTGEHLFSAWITFFFYAITNRLGKGEWKIQSEWLKCIAGVVLAFYIYNYTSDMLSTAGPEWMRNSFGAFINGLVRFYYWLINCMPDWFYVDGWLNLWLITRTICRVLLGVALLYAFVPVVMALPFSILYELWHKRRDMPNTTYEWVAVLVIFPLFFTASMWVTYQSEYYNEWYWRILYLFISSLILAKMAGYRKRCPKCGGSHLILKNRYRDRDEETHIGTTTEKGEVRSTYDGSRLGSYEKVIDHYETKKYTHSRYICERCGNDWWETNVKTSKRDIVTDTKYSSAYSMWS